MNVNSIIIAVIVIAIIIAVVIRIILVRRSDVYEENTMDIGYAELFRIVMEECVEIVKEDTYDVADDLDLEASLARKKQYIKALKDCVYSIDSAKAEVISLIHEIIAKNCPTESSIRAVKNFDRDTLDCHTKFEVLMYFYQKDYGKDSFKQLVEEYNLDRVRYKLEDGKPSYLIDDVDINTIYAEKNYDLSYQDQVRVLAILMFQQYKGLGCIDTIRAMNLNGVNIGASGQVLTKEVGSAYPITRSVWVYFNGKQIHMRFLDLGSEGEMARIVQLVIRWNQPGSLHEKKGFIVNTMYDKSRVTALRPNMSASWAVFIRKFSLGKVTPKQVLFIPGVSNAQLPYYWTAYLLKCQLTTAITGEQGSGKTTFLSGFPELIDPRKTIRTLELAPELYLQENFPERNILSTQETETLAMEHVQDLLKKTDAQILIIGEIASDPVALRAIQAAQVGYECTFFSHHANTAENLVYSLRNSCIQAGGFNNELIAEQQVVAVLKLNMHLSKTITGVRYVSRCTEIVPVPISEQYPRLDRNDLEYSRAVIDREYYYRSTDRASFVTNQLFHFDTETMSYVADNPPSPKLVEFMCDKFSREEKREFLSWLAANWKLEEVVVA